MTWFYGDNTADEFFYFIMNVFSAEDTYIVMFLEHGNVNCVLLIQNKASIVQLVCTM